MPSRRVLVALAVLIGGPAQAEDHGGWDVFADVLRRAGAAYRSEPMLPPLPAAPTADTEPAQCHSLSVERRPRAPVHRADPRSMAGGVQLPMEVRVGTGASAKSAAPN